MLGHEKVFFRLEQDEHGYPPTTVESMWAVPLANGNMRIDSIPFYVMGISNDDEIEVRLSEGEFWFKSLTKPSRNSTFRLVPATHLRLEGIRKDVERLGCQTECHKKAELIAVDVPKEIAIQPFLDYIMSSKNKGLLDFEEAALRHIL